MSNLDDRAWRSMPTAMETENCCPTDLVVDPFCGSGTVPLDDVARPIGGFVEGMLALRGGLLGMTGWQPRRAGLRCRRPYLNNSVLDRKQLSEEEMFLRILDHLNEGVRELKRRGRLGQSGGQERDRHQEPLITQLIFRLEAGRGQAV